MTCYCVVEEVGFTDEDEDPSELPAAEAIGQDTLSERQDSTTDNTHDQST